MRKLPDDAFSPEEVVRRAESHFNLKLTRLADDLTEQEFWQVINHIYNAWFDEETDEDECADIAREIVKGADRVVFEGCDRVTGTPVGRFVLAIWETDPVSHTMFWFAEGKPPKPILEA